MKTIVLALTFFTTLSAFAQKKDYTFGDIKKEDFEIKSIESEPDAPALIIADILEYSQNIQIESTLKRYVKIKINSTAGFSFANVELLLFSNIDRIKKFKAFTYNLVNNEIEKHPLTIEDKFNEDFTKGIVIKKYAMNNVKVGSIIEYEYEIATNSWYIGVPTLYFQYQIPVLYARAKVSLPQTYDYLQFTAGHHPYESISKSEEVGYGHVQANTRYYDSRAASKRVASFKCNVYEWTVRNVPSIKEEIFVPSINSYRNHVYFELKRLSSLTTEANNDWKKTEYHLLYIEELGQRINNKLIAKKIIKEVNNQYKIEKNNKLELAVAIHHYIKNNIQWNGRYSKFNSKSQNKILEDKTGNCSDINLLLVSTLRYVGIEADPVILSTRNNGKVHPIYPILSKFNYVMGVCTIGGKTYFLDATDPLLKFGEVPENTLNGEGRVISELGGYWLEVKSTEKSKLTISVDLAVDELGKVNGVAKIAESIHFAHASRSQLTNNTTNHSNIILSKLEEELAITDFLIENIDNPDLPLKYSFGFSLDNNTKNASSIYLSPILLSNYFNNPFQSDTRLFPIDIPYQYEVIYLLNIQLPENMELAEPIQSKVASLENLGAVFSYNAANNANKITIMSKIAVNELFYTPDKYLDLKQFFQLAETKTKENLIITKRK